MTRDEFFAAVCQKFGWQPTPWRLAVFNHWATQEGMPFDTTFNPLATTRLSDATPLNLGFSEGYGPGNWNGVPVRVYASPESGIEATFETLALGYYDNIRRCFTDQAGYPDAVPEFTTYVGNVSYGQRVVDFMNSTTASKGDDEMTPEQARQLAAVYFTMYGGDPAVETDYIARQVGVAQSITSMEGALNRLSDALVGVDQAAIADALIAAGNALKAR
jgi:hypothetical protein